MVLSTCFSIKIEVLQDVISRTVILFFLNSQLWFTVHLHLFMNMWEIIRLQKTVNLCALTFTNSSSIDTQLWLVGLIQVNILPVIASSAVPGPSSEYKVVLNDVVSRLVLAISILTRRILIEGGIVQSIVSFDLMLRNEIGGSKVLCSERIFFVERILRFIFVFICNIQMFSNLNPFTVFEIFQVEWISSFEVDIDVLLARIELAT